MSIDENLVDSAKTVLEEMNKKGQRGDVYAVRSRSVSHSIEKGEVKDSSEYEDIGLGIRVIKNGKIGFGYCVPGNEERGVKRAMELSNFSKKLDLDLPMEKDKNDVKVYDERVEDALGSLGIELTQKIIDGCSSVKDDIVPTGGGLDISVGTKIIGNTEGLFFKEKGSMIHSAVMATLTGGETALQAGERVPDCKFDIDFEYLGKKAALKVDSMRKTSKKITGEHPVVISQFALTQLVGFGLIPAMIGENVRKGKSVYKGKLGEKVASEHLTLKDDPTRDWGLGSGAFDDEGVVSKETRMISHGVLEGFLYDLKEGVESSCESTANGVRNGFKNPPRTDSRNIVIRGEDKKTDEMLPREGIYVDGLLGAHTANPVSGDFSVVTNPVWLVKEGEKKGRIDGLMISGNLPTVLDKIELGDDYKKCLLSIGSQKLTMDTPCARIEGVTISSK